MVLPTTTLIRYNFGGVLPGNEKWRSSVWYRCPGGVPSSANLVLALSALNAALISNFVNPASSPIRTQWWGTGTNLSVSGVDVYNGGALVDQIPETGLSTQTGTQTTGSPNGTSCVITLLTAGFGRSSRGRVYIPYTSSIGVTLGVLPNVSQANLDNFKNFLDFIGGAPPFSMVPVVVSRATTTTHDITKVRADSHPDSQRGRERAIAGIVRFQSTL
jgi:hypothetical protein